VGSPKPGHTPRLVEDETLERIRHILGQGIQDTGLRDDAAVVDVPGSGSLVASVDSVVAGVHVDLAWCSPADVGWKALMGAVSDLAAMGARPVGALVALCAPPSATEGGLTLGVMEGVAEASRASACPVVGGDLSASAVLTVVVTVLGTVGRGGRGGGGDGVNAVRRDGARPGDAIFVTGPCGGSAAGLRVLRAGGANPEGPASEGPASAGPARSLSEAYRRPVARLAEGMVARQAGAHAMIDVSDGLALDLHRVADASQVGFVLDAVPVADGATLAEALGGGEDYELIVVIGPDDEADYREGCAAAGLRPPQRIGVITADPTERRLRDEQLGRLGWQHTIG
jgi:thiamine-monophosphate kinase